MERCARCWQSMKKTPLWMEKSRPALPQTSKLFLLISNHQQFYPTVCYNFAGKFSANFIRPRSRRRSSTCRRLLLWVFFRLFFLTDFESPRTVFPRSPGRLFIFTFASHLPDCTVPVRPRWIQSLSFPQKKQKK